LSALINGSTGISFMANNMLLCTDAISRSLQDASHEHVWVPHSMNRA